MSPRLCLGSPAASHLQVPARAQMLVLGTELNGNFGHGLLTRAGPMQEAGRCHPCRSVASSGSRKQVLSFAGCVPGPVQPAAVGKHELLFKNGYSGELDPNKDGEARAGPQRKPCRSPALTLRPRANGSAQDLSFNSSICGWLQSHFSAPPESYNFQALIDLSFFVCLLSVPCSCR